MRYKIVIEYDGSYYNGWQKQHGEITIQDCLEKALYSIFHKDITIFGSGRTDAGVHAKAQVAHFDLDLDYSCNTIVNGLNFYLREQAVERVNNLNKILKHNSTNYKFNNFFEYYFQDITIKGCEKVADDWDARYSAIERSYEYLIYNSFQPSALMQNRAWQVQHKLNIDKMQEASQLLIGRMDFSSFRASSCQAKNPVKTVKYCNFERKNDDLIVFTITAKSFLHHMVRNIIGTLKNVGTEKLSIENFREIIEVKDRTKAGVTAPPYGLYFKEVKYK